jgi:hypothetical protein
MIDAKRTIISQYANSPKLLGIIESFNDAIDPRVDLEKFYNLIWNVETAEGYGLDVWGRIVGVDRVVNIPITYFGNKEQLPDVETYQFGHFYSGQELFTKHEITDDEVFRRLILAKAATNISDGTIKSTNAILLSMFPNRGNAYVREEINPEWHYFGFAEAGDADGYNQDGAFPDYLGNPPPISAVTFVFKFALEDWELAIAYDSDALPRIAGIPTYVEVNP